MPGSPLISVIVPVYEVEQYLPECLDSVLGQDGPDLEVIAVDDASPDGSGRLLDERAAADPRLKVVHLEANAGPGNARNTGLALAAGEYVWFIDGDDALAPGALTAIGARLAPAAEGSGSAGTGSAGRLPPDVLLIGWESSYPDGQTEPSPGAAVLARVPADGTTLEQQPRLIELTMTSWSKLLRREFLAKLGVSFAAGIHEDVLVTCAALLTAESIGAVDQVCYRYRRDRSGSFMATTSAAHLAIFASYERVMSLVAAQRAAGVTVSDAVRTAIFERAIWHYSTVLDAASTASGGLVPRAERRAYFARMHDDYLAWHPAGYQPPPGARGLKFRLIERGSYTLYAMAGPVNRARLAVARFARRGAGRA
jgi:CDP-glycerol glycerophosphotransferase